MPGLRKNWDEIAQEFGTSHGTVSKIIAKIRNEWDNYDAAFMRVSKRITSTGILYLITVLVVSEFSLKLKTQRYQKQREKFLEIPTLLLLQFDK